MSTRIDGRRFQNVMNKFNLEERLIDFSVRIIETTR